MFTFQEKHTLSPRPNISGYLLCRRGQVLLFSNTQQTTFTSWVWNSYPVQSEQDYEGCKLEMAIRICFGYLDLCTHSALHNIFFQQQKMILSSPMQIPSFLYLNISPRNWFCFLFKSPVSIHSFIHFLWYMIHNFNLKVRRHFHSRKIMFQLAIKAPWRKSFPGELFLEKERQFNFEFIFLEKERQFNFKFIFLENEKQF